MMRMRTLISGLALAAATWVASCGDRNQTAYEKATQPVEVPAEDFSPYNLSELLHAIEVTPFSEHMIAAAQEATQKMEVDDARKD